MNWDPLLYQKSISFSGLEASGMNFFKKFSTWPELFSYNQFLESSAKKTLSLYGKEIHCVAQGGQSISYESRIYYEGELQTRESNWHDFFNLLMWRSFPKSKALINKFQVEDAEKSNTSERSARQNYLTQFDECGVVVLSSDLSLSSMLTAFEWKKLFWEKREEVLANMRFIVFGHAIYEKLLNPYIGLTAKSIIFQVDKSLFSKEIDFQHMIVDNRLSNFLLIENLRGAKELAPLPILGIPGWAIANKERTFYDDTGYFRAGRNHTKKVTNGS